MKIKIEMYVRTKYGIKKIYEIDENKSKWKYLYKLQKQDEDGCVDCGVLANEHIIKASYNITDLIEEGDYVNGMEVFRDEELNYLYVLCIDSDENIYYQSITKKDYIKSIVTKEQFESMKYEVE